ncbi:hypothetical protein G6F24_016418 [Rhizopus arrhizus]|nr:hypothetical protein G6F24_016418 [Rhizopus arrhizus]
MAAPGRPGGGDLPPRRRSVEADGMTPSGAARLESSGAADDHEAAFALVTGHADARQALQRLGHVLVRVLAQRLGGPGVLDGIAAALEVDRADLRFELRTHFDAVEVDRVGGHRASGGNRLLPGGLQRCNRPHRQGQGDGNGQRSLDMHWESPFLLRMGLHGMSARLHGHDMDLHI